MKPDEMPDGKKRDAASKKLGKAWAVVLARRKEFARFGPAIRASLCKKDSLSGFGSLRFTNNDTAKFLTIGITEWEHQKARKKELLSLLFEHFWKLPKPELLISVTGSAASFGLSPRLKLAVESGFVRAASDTSSWVFTGGTDSGVMEVLASAMSDHDLMIPVIGLTPHGCVKGREKLTGRRDELSHPTRQATPSTVEPPDVDYDNEALKKEIDLAGSLLSRRSSQDVQAAKESAPLNHNHSHVTCAWLEPRTADPRVPSAAHDLRVTQFVLVDSGVQGIKGWGTEIGLRYELEAYIAKKSGTPAVQLVVGGGAGTLKNMREAARFDHTIVIVAGSGGAADAMFLFHTMLQKSSEDLETRFKEKMMEAKLTQFEDKFEEFNELFETHKVWRLD